MKMLELIATKIDIPTTGIETVSAEQVMAGALSVIYFVIGAFAVIVIILAGYTFITSSGDAAKISKARNAILYSVIGLVVVIMAFAITAFIYGKLD
jgi:heme O synthase-like polyprenyltransferase